MYNGKTKFYGTARRIVINRRTGQLGSLGISPGEAAYNDAHALDEVAVTVKKVPNYVSPGWPSTSETNPNIYGREVPNNPYKPTEYDDMQVIEVSGTRIPWWVWGVGGLLGAAVLFKFSRGR